MGRKDFEHFIAGWFVGDMMDQATKNNKDRGGFGAVLLWGLVLFILYCVYVLSGVKFESIWSFLKMVTFPVTWDYQLLDFKLFGTNNYYSFIGAIVSFPIILNGGIFLEKRFINRLEGMVLKKRIGNFPPVRTAVFIITTIFNVAIVPLYYFYLIVIAFKTIIHGLLSIFTFLFSL